MNPTRRQILQGSTLTAAAMLGLGPLRSATAGPLSGEAGKTLHIESVRTIHSDGRHHAFTDITQWRGKYYVVFRSANSHATPWDEGWEEMDLAPGHITLAESTDLVHWTTKVVLNTQFDDRDAKLLATDSRLYIYATSVTGPATTTFPQEPFMVFTEDGHNWTEPVCAYRYNYGLWAPKTHQGVYYTAADIDVTRPGGRKMMQVELLRSEDGQLWQPVSTITRDSKRTETALVFLEDDSLLAVCRQSVLAIAQPPYHEWKPVGLDPGALYQVMPIGIPGPAADRIGDTVVVCCRGRKQEFPDDGPGQYRTSLLTFDQTDMSLNWHTNLPTEWGGDLSYAGILPLDDARFLLSYYDGELYEKGVPKRSDIKLAEIHIV
jgi:hypothetical protein